MAHVHGDLGLFERPGHVLQLVDHRAHADHMRNAHFLVQRSVDLLGHPSRLAAVAGFQLFNQSDFAFADGDDKILLPVRKKLRQGFRHSGVLPVLQADAVDRALAFADKVHLSGFDVDVPGQDIVQNDFFDKSHLIMLFVILGFAVFDGHGGEPAHQRSLFADAAGEHRVFPAAFKTSHQAEGISAGLQFLQPGFEKFRGGFNAFPDKLQLGAGGNHTCIIHYAQDKINLVFYLKQYALKQTSRHVKTTLCLK